MGATEVQDGVAVVLLSGGWDSTLCLLEALKRPRRVVPVFFDYGQPYAQQETDATTAIAHRLKIAVARVKLDSILRVGSMFVDRNRLLIEATLGCGVSVSQVYFGCRNVLPVFDHYGDSNWWWALQLAKRLQLDIRTPCVALPKWLVKRRVLVSGVQTSEIFSTEGLKL